MSLRARLSIIVSLLFLTGMVLGVSFQLKNARERVAQEIESSATLADQLLSAMLPLSAASLAPGDSSLLLDQLQEIDDIRHLDIRVEIPDEQGLSGAGDETRINAPAWFVRLVRPAPLVFRQPLGTGSGEVVVISTNPADEIEEVWLESRNILGVLLVVLLVLNSILYIIIGRWLKPVRSIVEGLEDAEHGNFTGQVPRASLPELKVIADKLNQLTSVLRDSKAENDRLTKRSLLIQEEERRHMARELHDEMGQSISAIKAIAFSLSQRSTETDSPSAEGARKIEAISNHISDRVRAMMSRLRPAILDDLGLVSALQHMVDEWNDHHQDTFCSFRAEGDFTLLDESGSINLYRIVQEALTNIARHAQADAVEIQLSGGEEVRLVIQDNGRGFEPRQTQWGMGLSGIRERVRAINGEMVLDTAPGKGVCISVTVSV